MTDSREVLRYAAKLLFQYRVTGCNGQSNVMRTCEERIIIIHATCAPEALDLAKERGISAQHNYKNSAGSRVSFEYVGIMELLHLGVECEEDEVWYEITQRKLPMERSSSILPSEGELNAIRLNL